MRQTRNRRKEGKRQSLGLKLKANSCEWMYLEERWANVPIHLNVCSPTHIQPCVCTGSTHTYKRLLARILYVHSLIHSLTLVFMYSISLCASSFIWNHRLSVCVRVLVCSFSFFSVGMINVYEHTYTLASSIQFIEFDTNIHNERRKKNTR